MTVYAARPANSPADRPADYAIKVIRRDCQEVDLALAMLARESQVGRAISHPHVVTIFTAHLEANPPHLSMPRLEGQSANELMVPGKPLNATKAIWIARQIAEGLGELHAAGWIHGDVKPANVHVSKAGHATLLDLGLAHRVGEQSAASETELIGTLHYMPPERFTSSLAADERSDIYSLGVMLFELLTGYLPFAATSPAEWAEAHRTAEPIDSRKFVPELHSRLGRLVKRMLAKDPLRRPQSAAEVVDRLVGLEVELFEDQFR